MKKIFLFFIFNLTAFVSLLALPFNSKLSSEELETLKKGEVLIRNIDYPKYMCLEGNNPGISKLYDSINQTKPNYLAEVIQVKPYKGNEDLPEKIRAALENIQDYAGIPYWSVRHQMYFNLYDVAEIREKKINDGVTEISSYLYMLPFGDLYCPITIEQNDDYLFYTQTNSNNLKFEGITCVKQYCMKSTILLFRDGDNWILYGAGGVKAPRVPFLTSRIETSFINRTKTFCNFIFTKLEN